MTIDTIIFDLDGVLVDTENIHRDALIESTAKLANIDKVLLTKIFQIDGRTTKEKLKKIKNDFGIAENILFEIDTEKQRSVKEKFKEEIFPNHRIINLLATLKHEGFKLGLGSNSRRSNVMQLLDILMITDFFESIVTSDNVDTPKPSPEIFLKVMAELNSTPDKTLILEDSEAGCMAAISSGSRLLKISSTNDTTIEKIRESLNE